MYAVVRTGGKQYRVQEGRPVTIERLPGEAGATIELNDVLLLGDGDNITIGAPTVDGARVVGTIREQGRAKKILVFHYKNKTRARMKNGHRQHLTTLMIDDVLGAGQQPKPKAAVETAAEPTDTAPKARRGRKTTDDAPAIKAETPAATATAEKPKRARRKAE